MLSISVMLMQRLVPLSYLIVNLPRFMAPPVHAVFLSAGVKF
jgi:hypothetical protein